MYNSLTSHIVHKIVGIPKPCIKGIETFSVGKVYRRKSSFFTVYSLYRLLRQNRESLWAEMVLGEITRAST